MSNFSSFLNPKLSELLFKRIFLKEIICNPSNSLSIKVKDSKPYLSVINGNNKQSLIEISPYLWDSIENMYYVLVYSEMLGEGYLLCPIENGVLCISPNGDEYQISMNPYHCTCGHYHWKEEGFCKHILMLKGFFINKKRISSYLATRF